MVGDSCLRRITADTLHSGTLRLSTDMKYKHGKTWQYLVSASLFGANDYREAIIFSDEYCNVFIAGLENMLRHLRVQVDDKVAVFYVGDQKFDLAFWDQYGASLPSTRKGKEVTDVVEVAPLTESSNEIAVAETFAEDPWFYTKSLVQKGLFKPKKTLKKKSDKLSPTKSIAIASTKSPKKTLKKWHRISPQKTARISPKKSPTTPPTREQPRCDDYHFSMQRKVTQSLIDKPNLTVDAQFKRGVLKKWTAGDITLVCEGDDIKAKLYHYGHSSCIAGFGKLFSEYYAILGDTLTITPGMEAGKLNVEVSDIYKADRVCG